MIKTISWKNNKVVFLDQRVLPAAEKYITCTSYKQVIAAIKNLTVRGAPAIGVAAAMGIALAAKKIPTQRLEIFQRSIEKVCRQMGQTRPTAVTPR